MDEFEEIAPDDSQDVEFDLSEDEYLEEVIDTYEYGDADVDPDDVELQADIIDNSLLTFIKHTKSVFASDVTKDGDLAVTGSEDDMAYVWSTKTGEILFECTGHKDSVTQVCFNHDCQLVATADMGGLVQVWNIKDKKLLWCFETDDIEWVLWHPLTNVLLCGCQTGDVYVWQVPQGNCKVLPSPSKRSSTCSKILPNGKQLLVGYEDGQLKLWDIKDTIAIWTNTDSETLTGLDVNIDGTLCVTAPSGLVIKLTDGKTIGTLQVENDNEIEAAVFNNELNLAVTGSLTGRICVWELGRMKIRHTATIGCAITLLKWGSDGKILVGASDGMVYVCDVKNSELLATLTGHQSELLSISVFNDGRKLLTTSDDGTAKIFEIKS